MKQKQRIICLLLAALMILSLAPELPARVSADNSDLTIDFSYKAIAKTPYSGMEIQAKQDNPETTITDPDYYKSAANKFRWVHVDNEGYEFTVHGDQYIYHPMVPPITSSKDNYSLRYYLQSNKDEHKYISLNDDFDMSMIEVDPWKPIEITTDKVLDLNGHALYVRYDANLRNDGKGPTSHAAFHSAKMIHINQKATLTIIDSSSWRGVNSGRGSGKISFTGYMCDPYSYDMNYITTRDLFWVDGSLVIYGGTFQAGRQKDQLKSKFSWKKFKSVIGTAVGMGVSIAEYATGINAATAAVADVRESFMDEDVPSGDNGGRDDPTTSTIKRTGSGGYEEKKLDTPEKEGSSTTGAGRDETVSEKKTSKNADIDAGQRQGTKEGENKADDKKPGKNDKNTKIAAAEKDVVDAVVNQNKIDSMVNGAFKLVDGIVNMVGKDEKSRITQCIQGTVAHVGNTGTLVIYDGTFKGYGSTPNTRNAVVEVTKQGGPNPKVPGKDNGGQAYIYGGTFEGYCGANIFNMVRANNSQTVLQYEKGTDGVVREKTVTLSEQETMGFQQIFYDNAEAFAADREHVTPVPVNTRNVMVRGGTFRTYHEVMQMAVREEGDSEHFNKFPGSDGSVNLGIESYGEDLIRDGRIQIVDRYGDGAMVLMDERTEDAAMDEDIFHYRLFCGDTELRYKRYLEVYPNEASLNATHTVMLDTYYGQNATHLLADAWGNEKECIREAVFANNERFITFPYDARNAESYYMIPKLTDTDVFGEKLDASEIWYYNEPLDYEGNLLKKQTWGDVKFTAPGKSSANATITGSQMTNSDKAWSNLLKQADQSKAQYTKVEGKSMHSNFKWFEYKVYRVDPLTRTNISESGWRNADSPLATVVYGTSGDSLKCKLPLKELERQIKKENPDWAGYRSGEMYRVVLTIEEYLSYGYIGNGKYDDHLRPARTKTSLCFRCVGINEDDPDGNPDEPDYTPLQWDGTPELGKFMRIDMVNAKAGLVDFKGDRIFDVYYQWYVVDDNGKPIRMIAGTDNIYESDDLGPKQWHMPERWDLNDGHTYVNTQSLPADKTKWTAWDIHMFTQEMCRDELGMRIYHDRPLSPENNWPYFSNSDSCYIPASLEGQTIRVKAIVLNLKWQKNFDKKQVFWSHPLKLPGEATNPLYGDLEVKLADKVSFVSAQHPATFRPTEIEGLRSDEYITSFTYDVYGRTVKFDNLHATSADQIPTVQYPQDFYTEAEMKNRHGDYKARVYFSTNKRSYTGKYQTINLEIEATGISSLGEWEYTKAQAWEFTKGRRLFWPEPLNATVGYDFGGSTSSDPTVAWLGDDGLAYFSGKAGQTTLSVKDPKGKTVTCTVRVVEEYNHVVLSGIQPPEPGKTLPTAAQVPKDAPYHVQKFYWTEWDQYGDPLPAGTQAQYNTCYYANVVIAPNDCARFNIRSLSEGTYDLSYTDLDGEIVTLSTTSRDYYTEEHLKINNDGTVTLMVWYPRQPDHVPQEVNTVYIDFPNEVVEGTNVSEWMDQISVTANGFDTKVEAELVPTYSATADKIIDTYTYLNVLDILKEKPTQNFFTKGVQTGIGGKITLHPHVADMSTTDRDRVKIYVNGKLMGKPESVSEDGWDGPGIHIMFSAPDTLTILDGTKLPPVMPAYTTKDFRLIVGQTLDIKDLLICNDPNVRLVPDSVDVSLSTPDDVISFDAETGTVTTLKVPESSPYYIYIRYTIEYDRDGDGVPEYQVQDNFYSSHTTNPIYASASDAPPLEDRELPQPEPMQLLDPEGKVLYDGEDYVNWQNLPFPEDTLYLTDEIKDGKDVFYTTYADNVEVHPGATVVYAWLPKGNGTDARLEISVDGVHYTRDDHLTGLKPDTDYLLYYRSKAGTPVSVRAFRTARTEYEVYVGRIPVTDENLGNLERDHWQYHPDTGVLTLRDLDLTDIGAVYLERSIWVSSYAERATISSANALTVELLGQNRVINPKNYATDSFIAAAEDLTITGTGDLLLTKPEDEDFSYGASTPYGLTGSGDLILNGSGKLTFNGVDGALHTNHDLQYRNGTIEFIPWIKDGAQHGRLMDYHLRYDAAERFKTDGAVHTLTYQLAGVNNAFHTVTKQELIDSFTDYGGELAIKIFPTHSDTQQIQKPEYLKSGDCQTGCVYYYSCTCGHRGETTFNAPATAHSLETRPAGPVTCIAPTWDAYRVCTKCGWTDFAQHDRGILGHDWQHTAAKQPTCTEDGLPAYDVCARCGLSSKQDVNAGGAMEAWKAKGHEIVYVPGRSAGCTVKACAAHFECDRCGKLYEDFAGTRELTADQVYTADALGHDWGPWETVDGKQFHTCQRCGETEQRKENPFVDVPADAYYTAPVLWAVDHAITAGTDKTHFSPNDTCTRAQVVTFLWRAAGNPEPQTGNNPFKDVKPSDYFYKPVLWAVENKITAGTSATTFSPNDGCTRGQVVTFLWRSAGNPAPGSSKNPFTDVKSDAYFYDPVLWAVEHKITAGTSDTTFSPNDTCTRAQIVTFLYRDLAE